MAFTESTDSTRIATLGGLCVTRGRFRLSLKSRHALGLLVYLADGAGRIYSRDHLCGLLWGGKPERAARHSLSQVLYYLRKAIGTSVFAAAGDSIALVPGTVWIDTEHIRLAKRARAFPTILHGYQGAFLDGFHVPNASAFEDWRSRRNLEMEHTVRWAIRELTAEARTRGDLLAAEELASRAVELDPNDEDAVTKLGEAIGRSGEPVRSLGEVRRLDRLWRLGGAAHASGPGADEEADLAVRHPEIAFVGRQEEFRELRAAWESAEAGRGKLVLLVGEAGIGKTRLAHRVMRLAAIRGGHIFAGRCYQAEKELSFSGLAAVVAGGLRSSSTDRLVAPSRQLLQYLQSDRGNTRGEPSGAGVAVQRAVEAFAQLFKAAGAPIVLFVDDFQWADEATLRVIARLSHVVDRSYVLIIAAVRAEEITTNALLREILESHTPQPFAECRLPPLVAEQVGDIITQHERSIDHRFPAWTRRQLIRQSAGRPLFVLELLRSLSTTLQDCGLVSSPQSSWARERSVLPPTIEQLLSRRFETLTDDAQQLAGALAILDREARIPTVQRVARLRLASLMRAIGEMTRAAIVVDDGDTIRFTHDLLREAAYRRLLPSQQRLLHERTAVALLRVPGTRPGTLAIHFDLASRRGEAYGYAMQAADIARAASALTDEEFFLGLAIANACDGEQRLAAESAYADVLASDRRYAEADEIYGRLIQFYESAHNERGLVAAATTRLAVQLAEGTTPLRDLVRASHALAARAEIIGDDSLQVQVFRTLVSSAHATGDREYMEALIEGVLLDTPANARRGPTAEMLALAASVQCLYGDVEIAMRTAQRAVQLADTVGEVSTLIVTLIARGTCNLLGGRLAKARTSFEKALQLVEEYGLTQHKARLLINYAVTLMDMGENKDAQARLQECLALVAPHDQVIAYANLAVIACELKLPDAAREYVARMARLNKPLCVVWVDVVVDTITAYCHHLEAADELATELALKTIPCMDLNEKSFTDCSYIEVFLIRILERAVGVRKAVERASSVLELRRMPVTGRLRVALELARLRMLVWDERGRSGLDEVIRGAQEVGADGIRHEAEVLKARGDVFADEPADRIKYDRDSP